MGDFVMFALGLLTGIVACAGGFGLFCLHVYTKDSKNKMGSRRK